MQWPLLPSFLAFVFFALVGAGYARQSGRGVFTCRRNHLIRTNHLGVDSVVGVRRGTLAVDVGAIPSRNESQTGVVLFGKRFSSDTEGDGPGTTTTTMTTTTTTTKNDKKRQ